MTDHFTPVQPSGQIGGGDRRDRRGIGNHEPDARRRQRRVDRQIGRPGLEHRQDRDDRLGRTRKQQRHTLARARAVRGKQLRQPVAGVVKLAGRSWTGPGRPAPPPPGCVAPARRTTPESTPMWAAARSITARLPTSSSRACSAASSRSTDDNDRCGSAVTATNTRCNR